MPALIPNAGVYEEQTALAHQAYDRAIANVKAKTASTYNQYGLTADVGPTGSYSNVRVDPAARYGLVQMLKYNAANQYGTAHENSVSRGIAGPGLGNQAESRLRFEQGAGEQQLGSQFMNQLAGLYGESQDALNTYNQNVYGAQRDALASAIQAQGFDQLAGAYSSGADKTTTALNNLGDRFNGDITALRDAVLSKIVRPDGSVDTAARSDPSTYTTPAGSPPLTFGPGLYQNTPTVATPEGPIAGGAFRIDPSLVGTETPNPNGEPFIANSRLASQLASSLAQAHSMPNAYLTNRNKRG